MNSNGFKLGGKWMGFFFTKYKSLSSFSYLPPPPPHFTPPVSPLWCSSASSYPAQHYQQLAHLIWHCIAAFLALSVHSLLVKQQFPIELHIICLRLQPYNLFWMEASRCAYKRNVILNSVRQHNHFITKGNYKADLIITFSNKVVVLTYTI